jgi:hypothetical protein
MKAVSAAWKHTVIFVQISVGLQFLGNSFIVLWCRRSVAPLWKLDDYIPAPLQCSVFCWSLEHVKLRSETIWLFFMALILRNHEICVVTRKARNDGICWQKIMGYEFLFDIYHIMTAEFYLFMNFYSLFFFFAIKNQLLLAWKKFIV